MLRKFGLLFILIMLGIAQTGAQSVGIPALHINCYDTTDPVDTNKQTTYVFEARNEGTSPCTNIQLTGTLCGDMSVAWAEGPTQYRVKKEVLIYQPVPILQPGEKLIYRIVCNNHKTGYAKMTAALRYDQFAKSLIVEESTTVTRSQRASALHINSYDTEDPVKVGKQTLYIIEVRNEGTASCSNVSLCDKIPAEMEFIRAEGPGNYHLKEGTVVFEPYRALSAGQKLTYKIYCKSVKAGSAKNRATLRWKEAGISVNDEEGTSVYK